MAIKNQIRRRYASRNEEIVADLRKAAGAVAPLDQRVVVKRKAAEIAMSMALLHGGEWWVHVDHEAGLVTVARHF